MSKFRPPQCNSAAFPDRGQVGWLYSASAGRVLTVLLLPKDHPPAGDWWGVNAWAASSTDERKYQQRERDREEEE